MKEYLLIPLDKKDELKKDYPINAPCTPPGDGVSSVPVLLNVLKARDFSDDAA